MVIDKVTDVMDFVMGEYFASDEYAERYPLGHPSQELAQSYDGQGVMDNRNAITVGDKVTIDDCPGHWISFSPFKVEAIEEGMVKLEMVSELIDIDRLRCWNG